MKRHLLDDGRNIDPSLGILAGEGAHQEVRERSGKGARPVPEPRERAESTADADSYYGLPMLKEPVWKWPIPTYFYVGGVAGASAVLGAAAGRTGDPALRSLCERTRLFAAGEGVGSLAVVAPLLNGPPPPPSPPPQNGAFFPPSLADEHGHVDHLRVRRI